MEIYETQSEIAKRKNWLLSLVVIVLVTFGVLILLQGVALALTPLLFNLEFNEVLGLFSGDYEVPNGRMAMLFVQGIGSGIGFWLSAWILIHFIDRAKLNGALQLARYDSKKIGLTVLITLGAMFFNGLLVYWNSLLSLPEFLSGVEAWMEEMELQLMEMTKFLTDFQTIPELLMGILVIGVLAGIGEEMFFRGLLQPKMHRYTGSVHAGIWITAIIFSAIHVQFYGFFPRMFLGALFGYLYVYSGSLIYPVLAHIFNNTFTVILVYAANQGMVDFDIESNDSFSYPLSILGLLVLLGGIYYFKQSKPISDGEMG
ncbi:MAG: CPBP family intramembrane glutamic endopeptidase [Bacteroidota bacterium]|uniref:CAAX prenyl protease 2/Lysostaphin resistance protein A-like domain-containing protein n=1 Tax=Algoriphagus faecimaris TaxID=686796 RepID=A0A1G6W663_9BACT|nr:CPBP family intramembrane glutamic endopeptidase [Algoriphagus faecimaris]SDD61430.1 hypothetical protein SAMN04488104_104135 [Algoriphagus faecimaris]